MLTTEQLQSFCALPSELREYLHKPMRVGAWVYATNGHYCVRVPAGDEPEVVKTPTNMHALFEKHAATEFVPMPEFEQAAACDECKGSGLYDYGDGDGYEECYACLGRGFEKWRRTRVGDAEFELGYLNKLATLPNVQIHTRGPSEPMTLRFDGGEALLMPMLPNYGGS